MPRPLTPSPSTPRFAQQPLSHHEEHHAPSAEAFYFQKQMQQHTPLCVVLENGDSITGTLEWFDDACIKLRCRHGGRVMVYKHGIRYLHKVEE